MTRTTLFQVKFSCIIFLLLAALVVGPSAALAQVLYGSSYRVGCGCQR